jgi:hypothetical protein
MSKSNIEKERLSKIKAFKNGECEFDVSMIKLKMRFEYYDKWDTKQKTGYKKQSVKSIGKEVYALYKELFTQALAKFVKKTNMFDITVMAGLTSEYSYNYKCCQKQYDTSKRKLSVYFLIEYKNKYVSGIHTEKEIQSWIIEPDETLEINSFFLNSYNNIKECVTGRKSYIRSLISLNLILDKNRVYEKVKKPSKLPKVFKDFVFYKNINFVYNYIRNNNSIFRFTYYAVTYNIMLDKYYSICVKDHKNNGYNLMRQELFHSNMDILKGFEKMGLFPFDVKDVENTSEEEILDMYTLLTY